MAKRFTDTEKYKKAFYRKLPGAYKLFWDFICHDCDHAGIWHVDLEVAQIYIGQDMKISIEKALELFNEGEVRIEVLDGGAKWFIRPFIEFQYGVLNDSNRVHHSILAILKKNKIKPLTSPLKGVKDKDKDKDKDIVKDKEKYLERFGRFWKHYPRKKSKGQAEKTWLIIKPSEKLLEIILAAIDRATISDEWTKDHGQYIPHPSSWLNAKGWEDEHMENKEDDWEKFLDD